MVESNYHPEKEIDFIHLWLLDIHCRTQYIPQKISRMKVILDAARCCDFATAKEVYDSLIAEGKATSAVLNEVDGLGRSAAHYAAEYDEVVALEWLYNMGCDLFRRDNNNRSPIDIAVKVDAKLRKKNKGEGEVLPFLRKIVLNPVQQIFYLELGESTDSVPGPSDISNLTLQELSQSFPFHNNMQAIHVFASHGRMDILELLKSRGVDMTATDDDGNNILHFASTPGILRFGISACGIDVDSQNESDGNTPAHMVIERVANDDLEETIAIEMIKALIELNADFSRRCDAYEMGVTELALEMIGRTDLVDACMKSPTSIGGLSIEEYMQKHAEQFESDSDISVASHTNKVLNENSEEDSDDDSNEDDGNDDQDNKDGSKNNEKDSIDNDDDDDDDDDGNDFFFRPRK